MKATNLKRHCFSQLVFFFLIFVSVYVQCKPHQYRTIKTCSSDTFYPFAVDHIPLSMLKFNLILE